MRPRGWTDEELRAAVAASTRLIDVLRRLRLSVGGRTLEAVRNRILQLGLDTSHMERPPRSPKWDADPAGLRTSGAARRTWTDADLRRAVRESRSIRGVLVLLGLKVGGSQYPKIRAAIEELGLDTSHFTGQAWNKGMRGTGRRARPLSELLVERSPCTSTHDLRLRLLREGVKEHRCEVCKRTTWRGQPIPLQLDHINGIRDDNRLANLRLLCPNCHAQTETYCGKNIGRGGTPG